MKGEAGVGKTRLLGELRAQCEKLGVIFLTGNCYSSTIPYSPWTEAVNQFIRGADSDSLRKACRGSAIEVVALVPALGSMIATHEKDLGLGHWLGGPGYRLQRSPSGLPTSAKDESGRMAFFEGVTQFFTNISKQKPLVVSLEDLHHADTVTLQLLRYFTRHVFEERLLIIGSYREEEIDPSHPLSELVADLEKEALGHTLALGRFSREITIHVLTQLIGAIGSTQDLVDSIWSVTQGNPYFILETLRNLADQGTIRSGLVDSKRLRSARITSTVKGLLKQRLEHLEPECIELLSAASVIGQEVDCELLRETLEIPEDKMLNNLDAAFKAGLLQEREAGTTYRVRFADPRIRSLLLDDLSKIRRRKLHERIAQNIERIHGNQREHSAEIAYHYLEAGNREKAVYYSTLAGEIAASTHAYDEAVRHFGKVVELEEGSSAAKEAERKIVALQRSIESWNRALEKAAVMVDMEGYTKCAELWEATVVPLFKPIATRMVEVARLQKGERVLDIGTGTGLAAFLAGEHVGSAGRVLGIDLSEGMLSVAIRKSQNFPHKNVEFKKMDETLLDLPDSGFDAVICNFGLPAFNADQAFKGVFRVLRPSGRFVFSEWTEKGESKAEQVFESVFKEHRVRSPSELLVAMREATTYNGHGYSRLHNRATLTKMLEEAGFKAVSCVTFPQNIFLPTVEDYIKMMLSWWTISLEVTEMSLGNRDKFLTEATDALAPLVSSSGLLLDWEHYCFIAEK